MSLLTRKLKQESPLPRARPEDPKTLKTVWEYYNEGMEIIDREREKEWLEQMDTILIFSALFAAFISAFLIELLGRLEQDPMDIIQDVLIYQAQMMRNSSLGPYVTPVFSPPEHIVIVNALFYASLGVMLLVAFIAMLIKSWVREFDRGLGAMSLPEQRAKTREFRYLGMKRWRLPEMVAILPLLIQISLLLFSIGLILFLFHISTPSFHVTTAIFGIGVLYYAVTTSISVFAPSSPFHSPLSRTIIRVSPYAYLLYGTVPVLELLARTLELVGITPSKPRRLSEKIFEKSVADIRRDEVQLSVVASALQRIHDSAPDSQHSEALHWSVWQLAGSATFNTPSLFVLPSWIIERENDEEYFSHRPPAMLVALLAVSLRGPDKSQMQHMTTVRALLQRMDISNVPGAQVVVAAFDYLNCGPWNNRDIEDVRQSESNLANMTRRMERPAEESLWLLSTLSEHCCCEWRQEIREPFLIEICLAILSNRALECDMVLLEAVVILAAMSCNPSLKWQRSHFPSGLQSFLLSAENPAIFTYWFEDTPSNYHKHLISLLFLIASAFKYKNSNFLAARYLHVITAKGDLPLYTSALTAIAPAMQDNMLSFISRMLLLPQAQELTLRSAIIKARIHFEWPDINEVQLWANENPGPSFSDIVVMLENYDIQLGANENPGPSFSDIVSMLENYDLQLGAHENPDPNILAIVFMFSKHIPSGTIEGSENVNLELKNPWLRLAARVVARLDTPDGPGLPMGSFYDHRVHNMIASLSLLRYTQGTTTQYTEFRLLESFLESRELSISSVAMGYYMKTVISYLDPPAPSHRFSVAVSAVFNCILTDYPLWMGWAMLDGFETLPVEWRRSFADGFFTLSRRPLLKPRGDTESMTPERELEKILTWEYFNEKEQEQEWTDSEFSGLDWMAMAWSLHLSQHSGRKEKGELRNYDEPVVNEEFVLRALCKLLDAAPSYQLTPIIPKLCEFLQWFDDTEFSEYRDAISTRIRDARVYEECQKLHRFHKFHCMWYI